MPNFDPTATHPNQLVAMLLVTMLLAASLRVWVALVVRRGEQRSWLNNCEEPRSTWTHVPEITALIVVFLLISLHLVPHVSLAPRPEERTVLTTDKLFLHLALTGGLALLLPGILISGHRPPVEYGLKVQPFGDQLKAGVNGFLLSLLPMAALMLATAHLRTRDNRNSLLILLSESSDPLTTALICLAAIVIAPLYEEMMFRVILQSWMTTVVNPHLGIAITAVLFGAIHGLPDGVALLPLAWVLGYVFHRRHSYLAVVVIHAMFNATMLTLALLIEQ